MDDADRLNSPLLPPRFLPGAPDEPFRFQGIPGIEATRGGNRFAVWYGGGDGEGPQNFLMLARRNPKNPDEWPIVLRVVHPGREIRCFDAALWLDRPESCGCSGASPAAGRPARMSPTGSTASGRASARSPTHRFRTGRGRNGSATESC